MTELTQLYVQGLGRTDGFTSDGIPGDCFRTALACLLDLEKAHAVPHFAMMSDWWVQTRRWLRARGDDLAYVELIDRDTFVRLNPGFDQLVLVGGRSPRGSFGHVVVGRIDGTIVWDPHPSRAGLRDIEEFFVLTTPYTPTPEEQ